MIVSVSRRTDVPAFYSPWFFRRLEEGYALVRNPMNPRQVSRVSLLRQDVDAFVFWTKNPLPMLERLPALEPYPYCFQFTLTAYGRDVEPGIPSKGEVLVPAFRRLSRAIGPHRVIWRYDPIFLSDSYTPAYHLRFFEALAQRLSGYGETCVISFLDFYRSTRKRMAGLGLWEPQEDQLRELAAALAAIARRYGFRMTACAEALDLSGAGISPARCIDPALLERIAGRPIPAGKDRNQRPLCGCAASVDIGAYSSCPGGCRYCYADHGRPGALHRPDSPLLLGVPEPEDRVTLRSPGRT